VLNRLKTIRVNQPPPRIQTIPDTLHAQVVELVDTLS
jgi:hypothetical protein